LIARRTVTAISVDTWNALGFVHLIDSCSVFVRQAISVYDGICTDRPAAVWNFLCTDARLL
jgi:hypothetical protein